MNVRVFIFLTLITACLARSYATPLNEAEAQQKNALHFISLAAKIDTIAKGLQQMSAKCGLSLALPEKLMLDVDYTYRINTGLPFSELMSIYGNIPYQRVLLNEIAQQQSNSPDSCNESYLLKKRQSVVTLVENDIFEVKQLGSVLGFPKSRYTDTKIKQLFVEKLQSYRELPFEEASDLASDIFLGRYDFADLHPSIEVPRNVSKAIEIRHYLADTLQTSESYYQLARILSDDSKQLAAYQEAASQGHTKAQIWIGTYLSCINDQQNAYTWLNRAKQGNDFIDADEANDILLEIEDLGRPTTCRTKWLSNK